MNKAWNWLKIKAKSWFWVILIAVSYGGDVEYKKGTNLTNFGQCNSPVFLFPLWHVEAKVS